MVATCPFLPHKSAAFLLQAALTARQSSPWLQNQHPPEAAAQAPTGGSGIAGEVGSAARNRRVQVNLAE